MFPVHPYLLILPKSKVPKSLEPRVRGPVQTGNPESVAVDLGTNVLSAAETLESVSTDLPDTLLVRTADCKLTTVDFKGRSGKWWLTDCATPVSQAS